MTLQRISLLALLCAGMAACASAPQAVQQAPGILPSWNEGATRQSIIEFVEAVTDSSSPDFVPVSQRVAVFDNDGTLWAEKPIYFQMFFMLDRLDLLAESHPEWRENQPYKAALERDMATLHDLGEAAVFELVAATHTGMSEAEFEAIVSQWLVDARHPQTGKPFTRMIYQPMLELLDYLRDNGFETWIVSGGGISFMRPWTEAVYGIPPQQVVGTSFKIEYQSGDSGFELMRKPELDHFNDKEGKPVGIEQHIGRRPIFAGGNSDGDYPMLRYTTDAPGRQFGLYIHHTDASREWAYDRESPVGRLQRGLDDAGANDWVVVDMAADWKVVFPD